MLVVPVQANPNQSFGIVLDDQQCQITIHQLDYGLFLDLISDNTPIKTGQICQDRNRLVNDIYLGFSGDLEFVDTQGTADPTFDGLGTRYQLVYLEPSDLTS